MGGLSADSEWTALLAGFIIAGAGIGMINPAVGAVAVGVVPPQKAGMGSGINNTFRQVGISTGIAGLGALFQSGVESRLTDHGVDDAHRLGEAVASQGVRAAEGQGPQAVDVARDAFIGSLNELFVIAGIVALVGAALGVALTRDRDISHQH
jgi:MFS family permease